MKMQEMKKYDARTVYGWSQFDAARLVGRGHVPRVAAPNTGAGVWARRALLAAAGLVVRQQWSGCCRAWCPPAALTLSAEELRRIAKWRTWRVRYAVNMQPPVVRRHNTKRSLGAHLAARYGLWREERDVAYEALYGRRLPLQQAIALALEHRARRLLELQPGQVWRVTVCHRHYARGSVASQRVAVTGYDSYEAAQRYAVAHKDQCCRHGWLSVEPGAPVRATCHTCGADVRVTETIFARCAASWPRVSWREERELEQAEEEADAEFDAENS